MGAFVMNPHLKEEAVRLVQRAEKQGSHGKLVDLAVLATLNAEMNGQIPAWFIELLATVPLSGLELDWIAENGIDGTIGWSDARNLRSESVECYPGLAILERGYINVGSDPSGSGDSFFIPTDQGDDPPVYQIYHDVSDQADEILAEGRVLVASSLSDLFRNALLREP
jgi:hypothetical protein